MSDVITSDDDEDQDQENKKTQKKEASDDEDACIPKNHKKQKKDQDSSQLPASASTPQAKTSEIAEASAEGEAATTKDANSDKQPLDRTELAKQAPADLVALFRTKIRDAYADDDQDLQATAATLFQVWYQKAPTWKNPKKKDSNLPQLSPEECQAWVKYLHCLIHKHKAPVPYLHRQFVSIVKEATKPKR